MAERNTLQEMYEYQKLISSNGEEYVVRGAEIHCTQGTQPCVLNLPIGHGEVTADNRPLITINDTTLQNIKGFNYCRLSQTACSPCISVWSNGVTDLKQLYDRSSMNFVPAVIKSATARCKKNATIYITSSGQVIPDYAGDFVDSVDIKEDVRDNWNGIKDFLGHIRVQHSGVYNLGIHVDNSTSAVSGSVFMYYSDWILFKKYLVYEGAYEFQEHKDSEKFLSESVLKINTGGSDYIEKWTTWIELVLDKGTDYYIEIDCPNINNYAYKLIGNIDKVMGTYGLVCWIIDENHKNKHAINYYQKVAYENQLEVINCKIYLDKLFMRIYASVLKVYVYNEEHSIEDKTEDSVINGIITVAGVINTTTGVVLAATNWLCGLNKSVREKAVSIIESYLELWEKGLMEKAQGIILSFYDKTDSGPIAAYTVRGETWLNTTPIEGPKYLLGQFGTIVHTAALDKAFADIQDVREITNYER